MIGENATFTCSTIGKEAYWVLNAIPMTISYPDEKKAYEDQGVIFLEDIYQQYYNLKNVYSHKFGTEQHYNILLGHRCGLYCGNEQGDSSDCIK